MEGPERPPLRHRSEGSEIAEPMRADPAPLHLITREQGGTRASAVIDDRHDFSRRFETLPQGLDALDSRSLGGVKLPAKRCLERTRKRLSACIWQRRQPSNLPRRQEPAIERPPESLGHNARGRDERGRQGRPV